MHSYPLTDRGLLISEEIAALLLVHLEKTDGRGDSRIAAMREDGSLSRKIAEHSDDVPAGYYDPEAAYDAVTERNILTLTYCTSFDGQAETVRPVSPELSRNWDWTDSFMAYLPLSRKNPPDGPGYASIDEMLSELREALDGVIPAEFDLGPYLVDVSGTYFC